MEGLIHIPGLTAQDPYEERFNEWTKYPGQKNTKKIKNPIKKIGDSIKKGYNASSRFIANNADTIQGGLSIIKNSQRPENITQSISTDFYNGASNVLMTNPTTAWLGLIMQGTEKANLNSVATDFNDDFGDGNNLTFLENVGNLVNRFIPGGGLWSKTINPVDRSRLNGSAMYTWHNDLDKYNNGNKAFKVPFGASKLQDESKKLKLEVDVAAGIKEQGDRAMMFDPQQYTKRAENELNSTLDARYLGLPYGKQGLTLQFSRRTISKSKVKKHQLGGKTESTSLPKWLFYDEDKNEYASDFYEQSPKEDIQTLNKYVKENLPGWKVWKSPEGQHRYFVLQEKEANRRDMQILKQIEAASMSGSVGSKPAPPIGDSIGIDNKELTYVGNQMGANGKPYNFEDANGGTYWFPEYQKNGGKVNVIPAGALHAHKHNLTEVAEDGKKFEDVTTKGIPVVVEDEKGNLIQQAEVEREEIIFRLEVTKKLEELSKKHTDEAAIEAGKLLVYEILENTKDETNNML